MTNVKTRETRWANRMAARIADLESGRWLGVVPPSTVLRNNCNCRNYGRNTEGEQMRRQAQALLYNVHPSSVPRNLKQRTTS